MAEQQKIKLGYWRLRGFAQPIRLLLHYTNTPFEDVLYVQGDGPEFSRKEWLDVKFNLGLDFPNLPYYIAGDVKLTESSAIIRYIAEKNNLLGKDPEEKAWISMVENVLLTWRGQNGTCVYNANFEGMKAQLLIDVETKYVREFLSILKNRQFLAGDKITYVDFMLYEYSMIAFAMEPSFQEKYPKLVEYTKRIEALPAIKKYMESKEFLKYPFYGKNAFWGGKGDSL